MRNAGFRTFTNFIRRTTMFDAEGLRPLFKLLWQTLNKLDTISKKLNALNTLEKQNEDKLKKIQKKLDRIDKKTYERNPVDNT